MYSALVVVSVCIVYSYNPPQNFWNRSPSLEMLTYFYLYSMAAEDFLAIAKLSK